MKPYQFTKFAIASAAISLFLGATGFAADNAASIKGTWVQAETVETMSDGIKMIVPTSTRRYEGATGNGVYMLILESPDIPADAARHKIEDSFAYKVEGDILTERVVDADVIPAMPSPVGLKMARNLQHLLSRPNKKTLTIETLDDTTMVLYDGAADVRYTFKRE